MSRLFTRVDLRTLGELKRRLLRRRVESGLDETGQPFKRRQDGKPSRLRASGRLMKSISVTASDREVVVAPTADYAAAVSEDRPFIGSPQAEQDALDDRFLELLERREESYDRRRRLRR